MKPLYFILDIIYWFVSLALTIYDFGASIVRSVWRKMSEKTKTIDTDMEKCRYCKHRSHDPLYDSPCNKCKDNDHGEMKRYFTIKIRLPNKSYFEEFD